MRRLAAEISDVRARRIDNLRLNAAARQPKDRDRAMGLSGRARACIETRGSDYQANGGEPFHVASVSNQLFASSLSHRPWRRPRKPPVR